MRTAEGRRAQKRFLAEGIRVLEEAIRFQIAPQRIIIDPERLSDRATNLLNYFSIRQTPVSTIGPRQFERLADTREPQPMLGLFSLPNQLSLGKLLESPSPLRVLWAVAISDPGNLGTLIRSAAAFGFDRIVISGQSADPFSPKVVRASAGSIFAVRIATFPTGELLSEIANLRLTLLAAAPGGEPIESESLASELSTCGVLLAIGSEAEGLPDDVKAAAGKTIRISHRETVESLNAAIAGSIVMHRIATASA